MRESKVAPGPAGVVILAALNRFGYLLKGLGKTAEQIESQDVPQGEKPIAEADLFAFQVGAAIVTDRHFINGDFELRHFGRNLDFNTEAAGLDIHAADDVAPERLITRLNVGHVEIGQGIRKERENSIRNIVVEVQDARFASHQEPRSVHNVGVTAENRTDHVNDFAGIVFKIRILDDHD